MYNRRVEPFDFEKWGQSVVASGCHTEKAQRNTTEETDRSIEGIALTIASPGTRRPDLLIGTPAGCSVDLSTTAPLAGSIAPITLFSPPQRARFRNVFLLVPALHRRRSFPLLGKFHEIEEEETFPVMHFQIKFSYTFGTLHEYWQALPKTNHPQIDTCCRCEELSFKIKSPSLNDAAKIVAVEELLVHERRANKFCSNMKAIQAKCLEDEIVSAISFDFMKNGALPVVSVQESYYLRQLTVNVFSVTCVFRYKPFTILRSTRKGPNKVASFLIDIIQNDIPNTAKRLHVFFLNSCPGQNRNHTVVRFFLALATIWSFYKTTKNLEREEIWAAVNSEVLRAEQKIVSIHGILGPAVQRGQKEVQRFLLQVTFDNVVLTGMNYFSVTRSLILTECIRVVYVSRFQHRVQGYVVGVVHRLGRHGRRPGTAILSTMLPLHYNMEDRTITQPLVSSLQHLYSINCSYCHGGRVTLYRHHQRKLIPALANRMQAFRHHMQESVCRSSCSINLSINLAMFPSISTTRTPISITCATIKVNLGVICGAVEVICGAEGVICGVERTLPLWMNLHLLLENYMENSVAAVERHLAKAAMLKDMREPPVRRVLFAR
ncbi:hypothetical protein PR048_017920 [Dryococelus australis]|uniref:Uncharacterized protein n=1 Tax=Dryococelus australis TaxID=614101 RepID=A0ABQ9HAZ2_9NEOP|nr:hypothetical protein PR048_017920 [Dryococelus australis]